MAAPQRFYPLLHLHLSGDDFSYAAENRDGFVPESRAQAFLEDLLAALPKPEGPFSAIIADPESLTTDAFRSAWRLYLEHERTGAESFSANNPSVVITYLKDAMNKDGYLNALLMYAVHDLRQGIKHCATVEWDKGRGLIVSTDPAEPDVAVVRSLAHTHARRRGGSLLEQLVAAGIPEASLAAHPSLWEQLRNPSRIAAESANTVYKVKDVRGKAFVLKFHADKERAFREARATFHLGALPCIAGSAYRDPFDAEGVSVTLQYALPEQAAASRVGIEDFLRLLAQFHREAPALLADSGLELRPAHLREAADYAGRFRLLRRQLNFTLDEGRLAEAIAMLREHEDTVIHNDLIPDNILGRYMVDLENIGLGSATIDLALFLLSRQVPFARWPEYIDMYARAAEVPATPLLKLLSPAAYVVAAREAVNAPLYKPSSPFAKSLWSFLRGDR
ncbi:aminoglycoside phosphotransferase family protein [Candidatus Woesearchaeota archaeon]|nr:MAG: aminoglycoside phosphotransferase family protein [Candidatus Woesearchaeota archaeon]